ncbi:MAG TPA: hypothetical protein VEC38_07895 [Candidatus Binataceae bacterium]|nr:hypothetical protein [Candidatus Binataceae bacterium]
MRLGQVLVPLPSGKARYDEGQQRRCRQPETERIRYAAGIEPVKDSRTPGPQVFCETLKPGRRDPSKLTENRAQQGEKQAPEGINDRGRKPAQYFHRNIAFNGKRASGGNQGQWRAHVTGS